MADTGADSIAILISVYDKKLYIYHVFTSGDVGEVGYIDII